MGINTEGQSTGDTQLIVFNWEGIEIQRIGLFGSLDLTSRISMHQSFRAEWRDDGSLLVLEAPFDRIHERDPKGKWTSIPGFIPGYEGKILSVRRYGLYYWIFTYPLGFYTANIGTREVCHCATVGESPNGPDLFGMKNDLDGGLPFLPSDGENPKEMFCVYEAPDLIDCAQGKLQSWGGKLPEVRDSYREMVSHLTYEDNPVVAVARIK